MSTCLHIRYIVYLFEQGKDVVELGAGVGLEEPLEVGVHSGPGRRLLLRVIHPRDRLAAEKKVRCKLYLIQYRLDWLQ